MQNPINLTKLIIAGFVCLTTLAANAQTKISEDDLYNQVHIDKPNPFEKYVQVAPNLYVSSTSQFTAYKGAPLPKKASDDDDGVLERKRLGTMQVAPNMLTTIDLISMPMSQNYELRDIKTGQLIHEFSYRNPTPLPLLFTGNGLVYERTIVDPLCWGLVTRKYELSNNKLQETKQAMYFINAESNVLRDVILYTTPNTSSARVGSLQKGMVVKVVTYQDEGWLLVNTPLGLTGWLHTDLANSRVLITVCN